MQGAAARTARETKAFERVARSHPTCDSDAMTAQIAAAVPFVVVFLMAIVGMDLRFADFLRIRRYPVLVPCIVVGQWALLMPVAGFSGRWLDLPPAITGGALLIAAAPVAAISGYYTQLARGHLALAVTVAAVSNVLAVVATPLVATAGFRWFLHAGPAFVLPVANVAQQAVLGLLLPLFAGMLIRHFAADRVERWRGPLQGLGLMAVVAIVGAVIVDQFAAIRAQFGILVGVSALFTLAMLAVGLIVAKLATRSGEDLRTVIWGFPARNVAVATFVATSTLGRIDMASFIAVLFATQVALLAPLGLWLGQQSGGSRHDRASG
jgi:bile acid:Na+ symporter, BASS family